MAKCLDIGIYNTSPCFLTVCVCCATNISSGLFESSNIVNSFLAFSFIAEASNEGDWEWSHRQRYMTHHPITRIRFLENKDNLEKETYLKGDMAFKVQYRMKETTGKVRKYMKWGNVKGFILQIENLNLLIVWWFRTQSDELTSNTERDIFTEWNSRQSKPSTWKRIIFLHKVEAILSVKGARKISDVAVIKWNGLTPLQSILIFESWTFQVSTIGSLL